MNKHTKNQVPVDQLLKKPYESPEVIFFDDHLNDVISTSNPNDRGEWDVNPTQSGGKR